MTHPLLPLVNLNGSDPKILVAQHYRVYRAAMDLEEALAAAAPHGRDFQTAPEKYADARAAWTAHVLEVRKIVSDYLEVTEKLSGALTP